MIKRVPSQSNDNASSAMDASRARVILLDNVNKALVQNFVGVVISGDNSRMRMLVLDGLFSGRHFDREIIILCIRWYLRFKLSFRDLVEMMEERSLPMAHTTIMRWVRRYTPEFERRWQGIVTVTGSGGRPNPGQG
jgi:hypothetical protein